MSILERMNKAIEGIDASAMEEILHDDFKSESCKRTSAPIHLRNTTKALIAEDRTFKQLFCNSWLQLLPESHFH